MHTDKSRVNMSVFNVAENRFIVVILSYACALSPYFTVPNIPSKPLVKIK